MNEETSPSPSPNVNRSVYGYVLFLVTNLATLLYFVWAFVPDNLLVEFGVIYLPSKYWCLAIPLYFVVSLAVFAFFIYPGINFVLTKPLNSMCVVTDEFSKQQGSVGCKKLTFGEISPIYDLPIDELCCRVYVEQCFLEKIN